MPTKLTFLVAVLLLTVGVALTCRPSLSKAIAEAVPTPTAAPTATPIAVATVTPTPPDPSQILASANGATAAEGSLHEQGVLRSSNSRLVPGYIFTASVSWRQQRLRDTHIFPDPVFMRAAGGYVTKIVRVVSAHVLDQRLDQRWRCRISSPTGRLWQPPAFSFSAPRVAGSAIVRGRVTWKIEGVYVRHGANLTTRLRVLLFVDKARNLYLASSFSGTSKSKSGRVAHISGDISYSNYGLTLPNKQPSACVH
jgi:hypothetical protein